MSASALDSSARASPIVAREPMAFRVPNRRCAKCGRDLFLEVGHGCCFRTEAEFEAFWKGPVPIRCVKCERVDHVDPGTAVQPVDGFYLLGKNRRNWTFVRITLRDGRRFRMTDASDDGPREDLLQRDHAGKLLIGPFRTAREQIRALRDGVRPSPSYWITSTATEPEAMHIGLRVSYDVGGRRS
jgi:hypothetical protein